MTAGRDSYVMYEWPVATGPAKYINRAVCHTLLFTEALLINYQSTVMSAQPTTVLVANADNALGAAVCREILAGTLNTLAIIKF